MHRNTLNIILIWTNTPTLSVQHPGSGRYPDRLYISLIQADTPKNSVYLPLCLTTYPNFIGLHKLFPLKNINFYERSPTPPHPRDPIAAKPSPTENRPAYSFNSRKDDRYAPTTICDRLTSIVVSQTHRMNAISLGTFTKHSIATSRSPRSAVAS